MKKIYYISLALILILIINTNSYAVTELKVYTVNHVNRGDFLFMRTDPNYQSKVVVAIPYNAAWVASRHPAIQRGRSKWQKVFWSGHSGWVNAYYLHYDAASTKRVLLRRQHRIRNTNPNIAKPRRLSRNSIQKSILQCGGHSPFWSINMDLYSQRMKVILHNDSKPFFVSVTYKKRQASNNKTIIHAGKGRNIIRATLYKTNNCTDGITNRRYPYKIVASISSSKQLVGCCHPAP